MEHAHPKFYRFLEKMGLTSHSEGFSVRACTEGRPMKHLTFSDESLLNAVAALLPDMCDHFELHVDEKVICVPADLSRTKLRALVSRARYGLIKAG
jgi:hypothetical protein